MKEKIQSDLLLKVISVLIAIFIWLFVINTEDPVISKTFSDVPVDMLNEQVLDELNQTYQIKEGSTVSFTAKGKKTVLDKMEKSDFRATADVASMSDVQAIPIKIVPLKNKDQIEITSGNDQTVKVVLEDLRRSQIPVTVKTTGTPAKGYAVSNRTATPNLISISGPKSIVKQVKTVQVSVSVDGLKKNISTTKKVTCYDAEGDVVDSSRLEIDTNRIRVKIQFANTKTVPLVVDTKGKPANGYVLGSIDYSPKKIEITGEKDKLDEVTSIHLSTIDVTNSTKSVEKTIKASDIDLPDGIEFVEDVSKIADFVVKANISKMQNKTITLATDQIQLLNNENHYKVTFEDEKVAIKVEGLKSVISSLTAKDLNPKIDLSIYEPGTHTVQIQLKELSDMNVKGTPKVKITIEEE